jgi:hypothetical protein
MNMSLLGLELSDAGILVAGTEPAGLLKIDGNRFESPGFALPEKNQLIVGGAAEGKAHLYPRQILNQFWDQLNIEPLQQPNPFVQNHAEIAFEHLAYIWQTVKNHGSEMAIAVPSFYTREHLGLILGIAQELGIQVKGFVPLAVAAVPARLPEGLLLHLDIHLHRFEITRLEQAELLNQEETISAEGSGLSSLYRRWVDAVAEEFVRSTRFDPLHQAATEQKLYDRLPGILTDIRNHPGVHFEMTGGSKTYRITLTRDLFYQKGAPVFEEMRRLVGRFNDRSGRAGPATALILTDRIARLPGVKDMLADIANCRIIELKPGAGALGILKFTAPLFEQQAGSSAPFLTSRPLPAQGPVPHQRPGQKFEGQKTRPTHILYRNLAYPITEKPLIVGQSDDDDESGLQIKEQTDRVLRKHCTVRLQDNEVILNDYGTSGTFVDDTPVNVKTILSLGQTVRIGTPGETLKLIACQNRETDET